MPPARTLPASTPRLGFAHAQHSRRRRINHLVALDAAARLVAPLLLEHELGVVRHYADWSDVQIGAPSASPLTSIPSPGAPAR